MLLCKRYGLGFSQVKKPVQILGKPTQIAQHIPTFSILINAIKFYSK